MDPRGRYTHLHPAAFSDKEEKKLSYFASGQAEHGCAGTRVLVRGYLATWVLSPLPASALWPTGAPHTLNPP